MSHNKPTQDTEHDTDTELREQIEQCFVPHSDHSWPDVYCKQTRDNFMSLIKESNEKTARESRINELTAVRNIEGATVDAWASPAYQHILDRIEKLQSDTPNKEAKS